MKIHAFLVCATVLVSLSAVAAGGASYTIPAGVAPGADLDLVKCPAKHGQAVLLQSRVVKNGYISFTVPDGSGGEWEPKGRFKLGKPSKYSPTQKAVDEYTGSVPVVMCVPYAQD